MRTKRGLLVATAVSSLLVGIGIAGAQAPSESGRNAPGANAPSSQSHRGTSSEPRAQSQGAPQGSMGNRAQQTNPDNQSDHRGAQKERGRNENRGAAENRANENRGTVGSENLGRTEQNRGEPENRASERRGTVGSEDRSSTEQNRGAMENRGRTENRGTAERTEGSRGASLSTEQRTRIRDTVIHESNAPRISRSDINVDLRVGARIPRDRVRLRPLPLPLSVVEVEPQWRGYLYFLVGDEVVVVEPDTYEVVAVIPA